jgi:hypothetical protein
MNTSKLALIALLGSALMAFGCSEDAEGTGGSGGSGGSGGGGGGIDPLCQPVAGECMGGETDPITECPQVDTAVCTLGQPPAVADACTGSESVDNPDSCSSLGTGGAGGGNATVTYQLTAMQAAEDCNKGFNLDDCNGDSCARPVPSIPDPAPDGADGVDNALSSLQPSLVPIGASLTNVNQAFYDSLCGRTNSPAAGVCEGGAEAGDPCALATACNDVGGAACMADTDCTSPAKCVDVSDEGCADGSGMVCADDNSACTTDADCTSPAKCVADEGTCNLKDDDCLVPIPAAVITFEVDANPDEGCATVTVRSTGVCSNSGTCFGAGGAGTTCTSIIDCLAGEICAQTTACDADTGCTAPATCEGGGTTTSILNLSANSCLSGELEPIPTLLLSVPVTLGNPSVRMTLSSGGFSNGVLGATMDEATAKLIAASISEAAVQVIPFAFDISDMLTQDTSAACNALSMGLEIGGVTEPQQQ